jgi:hypothetical protein
MRTYGSVRGAISDGRPYRDTDRSLIGEFNGIPSLKAGDIATRRLVPP